MLLTKTDYYAYYCGKVVVAREIIGFKVDIVVKTLPFSKCL
jgi:hypothetical protein